MPNIFIAWELGSGLGHVGPLRAIGAELVRRGHTVVIAADNIDLCRQAFAGLDIATVPAPVLPISARRLKLPCTFSDILHDCGYSSSENVVAKVGEWLSLFDKWKPDLLLADHSPTALLASRMRQFATATVGVGFLCPPDMTPLPSVRREIPHPHWAAEVEATVLEAMNAATRAYGGAALSRVTETYGKVDRRYLLTLEEVDHYAPWRGPVEYRPPIGKLPAQRYEWPTGSNLQNSPKVFVYLHDHPNVLPILRGLAYKQIPTICYAPGMQEETRASFERSSVLVSPTPADLNSLASQCDAALLNGGHGTVCEFLRGGVPMLLLPLTLEQRLTGERLCELGVGLHTPLDDLDSIGGALEELLESSSHKEFARAIAQRYSDIAEEAAVAQLVNDIEGLVSGA